MQSGMIRRWLRGGLLPIVLVVCLAEGIFFRLYKQEYYGNVQQTMKMQFSTMIGQLNTYTGDTKAAAAQARRVALRRMVEQFQEKDKYEFMLLDAQGRVVASTSGVKVEGIVSEEDFVDAATAVPDIGVTPEKR